MFEFFTSVIFLLLQWSKVLVNVVHFSLMATSGHWLQIPIFIFNVIDGHISKIKRKKEKKTHTHTALSKHNGAKVQNTGLEQDYRAHIEIHSTKCVYSQRWNWNRTPKQLKYYLMIEANVTIPLWACSRPTRNEKVKCASSSLLFTIKWKCAIFDAVHKIWRDFFCAMHTHFGWNLCVVAFRSINRFSELNESVCNQCRFYANTSSILNLITFCCNVSRHLVIIISHPLCMKCKDKRCQESTLSVSQLLCVGIAIIFGGFQFSRSYIHFARNRLAFNFHYFQWLHFAIVKWRSPQLIISKTKCMYQSASLISKVTWVLRAHQLSKSVHFMGGFLNHSKINGFKFHPPNSLHSFGADWLWSAYCSVYSSYLQTICDKSNHNRKCPKSEHTFALFILNNEGAINK